jgi:hypothetical protein
MNSAFLATDLFEVCFKSKQPDLKKLEDVKSSYSKFTGKKWTLSEIRLALNVVINRIYFWRMLKDDVECSGDLAAEMNDEELMAKVKAEKKDKEEEGMRKAKEQRWIRNTTYKTKQPE